MAGASPILGIPYPDPGESADGPDGFKDVADRLDALAIAGTIAMPAGSLTPFAGTAAPSGWLLCQGQPVSRTTYSALFAAIGVAFGAGNGTTTFNIPDFTGRIPCGAGTPAGGNIGLSGGAAPVAVGLAAKGGQQGQALTTANLPTHSHSGLTGAADRSLSHSHGDTGPDFPDHSHGSTNAQYFLTANPGAQDNYYNGNDLLRPCIQAAIPGTGGASVRHGHTTAAAPSPDHQHAIGPEGGNTTHENMPPYVGVNYIIKT